LDPRWKNLDPGWKNSVHGSGRKILIRDDKHPGSATLITSWISKHRSSVADPGCLSRIRLFPIPDPGSELTPSRIRIKEFVYFNPKKWFLSSRKYDPQIDNFAAELFLNRLSVPCENLKSNTKNIMALTEHNGTS
jgi:hypothetical protein